MFLRVRFSGAEVRAGRFAAALVKGSNVDEG